MGWWAGNAIESALQTIEKSIDENCPSPKTEDSFLGNGYTSIVDPSGYVYEAVESNRLSGVTVSAYEKVTKEDMYGDPYEVVQFWDANAYSQENPLKTDTTGYYAWDVPAGLWQVRYEHPGYQTAYSPWLPVPPPQLEVHQGLVSYAQPTVTRVNAYPNAAELTFSKYMLASELTTNTVKITRNGVAVSGRIEPMNAEANPKNAGQMLASKVRFVPDVPLTAGNTVVVTVKGALRSYAGVAVGADATASAVVVAQPTALVAPQELAIAYGASGTIEVSIVPAAAGQGKQVQAKINGGMIFEAKTLSVTLNAQGKGTFNINALLPGMGTIEFTLAGTDLVATTTVRIAMPITTPQETCAAPTASIPSGSTVAAGTLVTLSCTTPGATIYYTLDGSCPCTPETRLTYTGPIVISATTLLLTAAEKTGTTPSDTASYHYNVPVSVTGVALSDSQVALLPNATRQLTATIAPENAGNKSVTWTSSNTAIATVSATGLVTAKAVGTATITVTTVDGGFKATCAVTVQAASIKVTGVTMNQSALYLSLAPATSLTGQLTATVAPANATNKAVTWTSSNTTIATVSSTGLVTAKTAGTATITVTTADGSFKATCTVTVYATAVVPTAITLSHKTLNLAIGQPPHTLGFTLAPANVTDRRITWTTSNAKVATVDQNGIITPVASGTATITAKATGKITVKATCKVTVVVPVTAMTLTSAGTAVAQGKTLKFTAAVNPANATNKKITYTLNVPVADATISTTGVLTVKATCKARSITVTATADGAVAGMPVTRTLTVQVTPVTLSIHMSHPTLNLAAGATQQLTATPTPSDASKSFIWTTSSAKVATVDANGFVRAVGTGTATITAKATDGSGKTATCKVFVVVPVTSMTLTSTGTAVAQGKTLKFTAAVNPATATNKKITYTLNVPATDATISTAGVLTVKATCKARSITVTATADGAVAGNPVSRSVTVQVTTVTAAITLNHPTLSLAAGNSQQLIATPTPSDASKSFIWTTSNAKVATVDANGRVTAIGKGTATITAKATDGSNKTATCKVTEVAK